MNSCKKTQIALRDFQRDKTVPQRNNNKSRQEIGILRNVMSPTSETSILLDT